MKKAPAPPPELSLESDPQWSVVTKFKRLSKKERELKMEPEISHYELLFGATIQDKATSDRGAEKLREIASFLNRRKMLPRDRIECAADAPNPQKYLRDLSQ